jgi:hypothetical protein
MVLVIKHAAHCNVTLKCGVVWCNLFCFCDIEKHNRMHQNNIAFCKVK